MNFLEGSGDGPIWDEIVIHTNGRARGGSSYQQININCPMCLSRGEKSADRRYRCGIKREASYIWVNCFNCGFKSRFDHFRELSRGFMSFLNKLGVPENQVKKLRLWSIRVRDLYNVGTDNVCTYHGPPSFAEAALPEGSKSLQQWDAENCNDPDFLDVVSYLLGRGDVATTATTYYWSPDEKTRRRLIIPCHNKGKTVGWVGRAVDDDNKRKYYNQVQPNFLFNADVLDRPHWKYVFVMEGIFDALAISGVAIMGADMNDVQARWIKQSGKIPVVIPDRDDAGKRLIQTATKHGWYVAIPDFGGSKWWGGNIKDVDAAVKKYGKLFVIRSILEVMTDERSMIEVRSKYLY